MSNQLGLAQVRRVIMSLSMEHNLIAIVFFTVLTQKMLSNAIRLVCCIDGSDTQVFKFLITVNNVIVLLGFAYLHVSLKSFMSSQTK